MFTVVRDVPGVTIQLKTEGYVAWVVTVHNERADSITVVWDESSFVAGDGVGRGRLIRGETRTIDTARSQPPTPVAPQARVVEYVAPEMLVSYKPPRETIDDDGERMPAPTDEEAASICAKRRGMCTASAKACAEQYVQCKEDVRNPPRVGSGGTAPGAVRVGVGRMVIVVNGDSGRETWEALLSLDGKPLPPTTK